MKVCNQPGCPELTTRRYCPAHQRGIEQARGTTTSRGYGAAHTRLRRYWAPIVATGSVACSRCHTRIQPTDTWHLDHRDDRTGYRGPSHARCNVAAKRR